MKFFRIALMLMLIAGLSVSDSLAQEKKGSGYESKGSPTEAVAGEDVAVSGKVMFADYYSMAGKKCAAFLDAEDGSIYCILDNIEAANLKDKLGESSGDVKIEGTMTKGPGARYIEIEKYNVAGSSPKESSGGEHKGSGHEKKGSGY